MPEFKAQVVLELISGAKSGAELCRQHQLAPQLLTDWKSAFVERSASVFQSSERQTEEAARVAELERLIGRRALDLEILKKASTLLASDYGCHQKRCNFAAMFSITDDLAEIVHGSRMNERPFVLG